MSDFFSPASTYGLGATHDTPSPSILDADDSWHGDTATVDEPDLIDGTVDDMVEGTGVEPGEDTDEVTRPGSARRVRKPRRHTPSSGLSKTQVEQVFTRMDAITALTSTELETAAALLDCDVSVQAVTVASFSGASIDAVVTDMTTLRGEPDDVDAMVTATDMAVKARLQPVYDIACALTGEDAGKLPGNEVKAARVVVKTIRAITDTQLARADTVRTALTA